MCTYVHLWFHKLFEPSEVAMPRRLLSCFHVLVALAGVVALTTAIIAQDAEYKPPRKWTFGSMGIAMRADLEVFQGGARNEAGEIVIKEKDRLVKWGGKELKTLDDFCRQL
jgi:hypothetical protein